MRPSRIGWAVAALLAGGLPSTAADRTHAPAPGAPRPLTLPPIQHLALANGLPVMLAETHKTPTVEVLLLIRSGAAMDPPDRAGLASMTADMLDEGAGGRDALALADAVDFLGAELQTGASWDYTTVRLHVPVARLAEALPLMADVALRPDFPAKELERLRRESLTALLQARDDPQQLASRALDRAVFGTHRYGRPESGDAGSVAALAVDEIRAFHARHYRPGNAHLIVVGDVTPAALPLLDKAFGAWPSGAPEAAPLAEPPQVRGRSSWVVDKPGAAQSVIQIGRVGPSRRTADYHALEVMNNLLGGSFTSRLNDNLREKHQYSYGAASAFRYHRVAGLFLAAADVETKSTASAVTEFMKELARIRTPATRDEIERSRNYLALGYAFEFETTRQRASKLAALAVYGLPDDTFASYVPQVLAVGAAEVRRGAEARIDTGSLAIVVVGDRAAIEAPLRALNLGPLRVLSVDDVMGPAPKLD